MEKTSDIQKPSSNIRKSSKGKESKVITSEVRKNKKGDPQQQRVNKPAAEPVEGQQDKEQQSTAQLQDNSSVQKPERKIVNEDEQKQVVNRPASGISPTEAEDQK